MSLLLPKSAQNLLLALCTLVAAAPACVTPTQNSNTPPPKEFNLAVIVIDRDSNRTVGQATVVLSVGNETLARDVTDDDGQANFSVAERYLGKSARIRVNSPTHRPADMTITLKNYIREIIPVISNERKPDPEPPPRNVFYPPPPRNVSSPPPQPTRTLPPMEAFKVGETKRGDVADDQKIDYRFEAEENKPLIFTARKDGESRVQFAVQIYDELGTPKKQMIISGSRTEEMDFTPLKTGSYVLRIRGRQRFGKYLVNMRLP